MTDMARIRRAADYLYEEMTKLDAPISMNACLVLAKHILTAPQPVEYNGTCAYPDEN